MKDTFHGEIYKNDEEKLLYEVIASLLSIWRKYGIFMKITENIKNTKNNTKREEGE